MLSSSTKDNNLEYAHRLRRQIHGLSVLLSIISPQIQPSESYTSKRTVLTVDDLLVHIATILNSDDVNNLVVAISGASASIMDLTLVVVSTDKQTMNDENQPPVDEGQSNPEGGFSVYQTSLDSKDQPLTAPRGLHTEVATRAQKLFSLLQGTGVLQQTLLWCRSRISARLTKCIARNRPMLEALSSYQLGTEDRDTFNTMFPSGISIDSKDVRELGMFIIFPGGVKSPKVISVDHLETWLHRIGKLPSVLNERLGTLGNENDPDFEKNCRLATILYKNLVGARKFLRGPILEFFNRSTVFRNIHAVDNLERDFGDVENPDDLLDDDDSQPTLGEPQENISPSLATLCHSLDLVLSWINSARALHHHAKKVLSPACNWKLVHITPLRPQPISPNTKPITCREFLADMIDNGLTPQDEVWLQTLPKYEQLDSEFDSKGDIHCEAALMALAANPSTPFTKNAGIENVLKEVHPTLAVPTEKCCYCCHLLGKILREIKLSPLRSPQTHGRVFPWIPPAGVDLSTLHIMKEKLSFRLREAVEEHRERVGLRSLSDQTALVSSYEGLSLVPDMSVAELVADIRELFGDNG